MRRREFVTFLGSAAVGWPLGVRAQQPSMPVVGLLRSTPAAPFADLVAAFREGLRQEGFGEGENVVIEQRWAESAKALGLTIPQSMLATADEVIE